MKPGDTPFEPGWWSFGLEGCRPCEQTYCLFPYSSLPPLPSERFQGDFNWLEPLNDLVEAVMRQYRRVAARERVEAHLPSLVSSANSLGIALPDPFIHLMDSPELQDRIPSCTACFFDLPEQILPLPKAKGFIVHFLIDQQGLLTWSLYINERGQHCVIASQVLLDFLPLDSALKPEDLPDIIAGTRYCAPTFEAFLYRFWMENTLWFALSERHIPLSDEQRLYIQYCKSNPSMGQ